MIVRDEAAFLEACLASLASTGWDCVVVDTGSTDDTVSIAQAHGCRVHHFSWCDDFSAARNASLALCTTPWIFVLDADERLAAGDLQVLTQLASKPPDCAYRVVTRNYTDNAGTGEFVPCAPEDPQSRGFAGWFPSSKVRLFPNRPAIRFSGQVHELVTDALAREGVPVRDTGIVVHHYGLARDAARLRAKREAYLQLGLAKAAAQPENAQAFAELGHQYLELDDLAGALRAYQRAVRLAPGEGVYLRDLGAALVLTGRRAEARTALLLAVDRSPGDFDAWRNLGVLQAEAGDWDAARGSFLRALSIRPSHAELRRYLALALAECGSLDEAIAQARLAVQGTPGEAQCVALYRDLMVQTGRAAEAEATLRALGAR